MAGLRVAGEFVRRFVVAGVNKFGVPEDVAGGPFIEFDFGNDFGFEPEIIFHVLGGHALAPVALAAGHRREIRKWTSCSRQGFEKGVKFAADGRVQARADFAGNRKAAASYLKVPMRTFYDRVERWTERGRECGRMFRLIGWRKRTGRRIKVRLEDSLQSGEPNDLAEMQWGRNTLAIAMGIVVI